MEVTMMKSCRWMPPMLLALGVWIASPGCSAPIPPGRQYGQNIQRRAFDEGHRKGVARGRDDAKHGRQRSYEVSKEYRNGDGGYRRDDGDREVCRESFRQGFRAGYDEAFNQGRDRDDDRARRH
jgi:hypothetical protein